MEKLRIGDKVIWRGSWGKDAPQVAEVEAIELNENGMKCGQPFEEIEWYLVQDGRNFVVSLTNGHWAYGYQISRPVKY